MISVFYPMIRLSFLSQMHRKGDLWQERDKRLMIDRHSKVLYIKEETYRKKEHHVSPSLSRLINS